MATTTNADLLALPVNKILEVVNTYLPGPLETYLVKWEQLCRSLLPDNVESALDEFLKNNQSVHSKNLPLMNPYHVVLIILVYFFVIFFGQIVMSFNTKFTVKTYAIIHNLLMVLLSAYMMIEVLHQAFLNNYHLWGNPQDETPAGWPMAKIIWLFYVSKIAEFSDTFIMVLKKNDRQISFLHVYHHFSIFAIWWLVTFVAPGGEAYYSAALNSFIHVVMYSYYLFSALNIEVISFIKHYVTMMQMTQFFTMLLQSIYDLQTGGGGYPTFLTQILFGYMLTMLGLFFNFLMRDRARVKAELKANPTKPPKSKKVE